MNKVERLAYMRSRFPKLKQEINNLDNMIGAIPTSDSDVVDELQRMTSIQASIRHPETIVLTSDEK